MKHFIFCLFIAFAVLSSCKKKESKETLSQTILPTDYLKSEKYTSLKIELAYDAGHPPAAETVTQIQKFFTDRIHKSAGITLQTHEIIRSADQLLSLKEIIDIEKKHRLFYANGSQLTVFIYLAYADYNANAEAHKVLGIQYDPTSVTLFGKTIDEFSGGIAQPATHVLESSVALHEIGHLLGLVNTGTSMVNYHQDDSHQHHCNNTNCLMYYAVETSDLVANILGGNIPALDVNCIKDLQATGGK